MLLEARDTLVRQLQLLEELIKARIEVDVAGMVAGVRARLDERLALEPLPLDADLASHPGPLRVGSIRTSAWRAPEVRKLVLSHVALRPMVEGLALVIHPAPGRRAPIFAADLMALPTRLSVNADVYGPTELTAGLLDQLGESFGRLRSVPGPAWAQAIASGMGLHARPSPRLVDDAYAALGAALGRYLEQLTRGGATNGATTSVENHRFFDCFHEHGPRRGPLSRMVGPDWAERYSRLLFE